MSRNAWRRNWVFHNFASGSVASATKNDQKVVVSNMLYLLPLSAELIQFDENVFFGLQPRTIYDELAGVQLMEACILGFRIHMFHDE